MSADAKLNLAQKKAIRDTGDAQKAILAKIQAATGVEAKWDIEADALEIVKQGSKEFEFEVAPLIQYMEALANLLEKQCADDMVKEAVADAMSAKAISFKIVPDLDAVKGGKNKGYNGITFDGGVITVFTTPNYWWTNVGHIENFDLVSFF